MGRFWLGVVVLILFLGLGIWTTAAMANIHEPMSQTLAEAAQSALSGDMQAGTALARQAKESWERHRFRTAAVADHTPMDDIDSLFAEMEVYAQAQEDVHFAACCAELSQRVHAMGDAHMFSWWNFL